MLGSFLYCSLIESFQVDWVVVCGAGVSAPLTATAMQQFVAAAGSGLGHEDDAAVAKIYARNAGIKLTKN